ncbi:mannosyltransferase [Sulfitobacter undariae]|uniref:Mannosyltransferase n=1 Tax=Sulfitobacter undariae TaxID=1563671 RepID=A0A7W6E2Q5_9RHOB|nr:glycosyltransferase family 4 protein [Sulfitobacter undariae]MBB3993696.1 mannosyltransferase [Sulfitobacter undariae]
MTNPDTIRVIAPNFKRRLSGVTATVVRLVPLQARDIGIVATGPVLPSQVPQIPLHKLLTLPRKTTRVWHARRNVEMIGGLALKYLLGKRLKLMFTSASQRKQSGLTRWLIRRMDAVVATSDKTAAYLESPATVIMHGIDLDDYAPAEDRSALRASLGLPDALLIGCYGRIRHQKGTDAFVDAMLPVLAANPKAHALIMGRATEKHATYLEALKDRVNGTDVADRVHFLPEVPVENMADWYRVLDLYVAPQRWEGFGLTPIEAMACGVPVVATRVGAFEQIVTPETGKLVDPDNIPELSEAITNAFASETLAQWSKNARPHVTEHFSLEREAAQLITLYCALLAS